MSQLDRNNYNYNCCYIDFLERTDFINLEKNVDDSQSNYLYSKDSKNNLVLHIVPGILELSSNYVGNSDKKGYIKKKFKPIFPSLSKLPSMAVPVQVNKTKDRSDLFILASLSMVKSKDIRHAKDSKVLSASVADYVSKVDSGYDSNVVNRIATCHWRRKIDVCRIDNMYRENIREEDLMKEDRVDYYGEDIVIVSVDPENCTDVDDAISIKYYDSEKIQIGIHIADPTSYIIEDSDLDLEALKRSETIYLKSETHHMYPEHITTSLFSLRYNNLCRAFSILFDFNKKTCEITNIQILKTTIKLNSNLTYDDFDNIISKNTDRNFTDIYLVGKIMYEKYCVDRDIVADNNLPDNNLQDYDSKKMIQAFMIYANTLVAGYLVENKFEERIVLRSQPALKEKKYFDKSIFCKSNSKLLDLHNRIKWSNAIVKIYSGKDEYDSHFGVGQKLYTHFTSPIRRYTDILVHRLLWNSIKKQKIFKLKCLDDEKYLHTMFYLNHNKKFYRDVVKFEREWIMYDCVKRIDNMHNNRDNMDPIRLNGKIVSFTLETEKDHTDKNIRYKKCSCTVLIEGSDDIYFSQIFRDTVFNLKIMSENMINSQISFNNSDIIKQKTFDDNSIRQIKYKIDGDEKKLNLFQDVLVDVVLTKGIRRFKPYLIL